MIDMETLYWIFGAIILMFNGISISLVLFGNTAEQNDGRKLFISSWAAILLVALAIYLFVYVVKPIAIVLTHAVWYSF